MTFIGSHVSSSRLISLVGWEMACMVAGYMFRMSGKILKVLYPIVVFNLIYMMHNLMGCKKSAQGLLHHKPMLKNISTGIRVRVVRFFDIDVAYLGPRFSTTPARASLPWFRPFRVWRNNFHINSITTPASFNGVFSYISATVNTLVFRFSSCGCNLSTIASSAQFTSRVSFKKGTA